MSTINQVKQLAAADTPILFFQCQMPSGDTYYWSSHSLLFEGQPYLARVLKHNLFTLQLSADDAMDGMSQLSIVLGNADAVMSELNAAIGFRGAQLTVYFSFVDLVSGTVTTESTMLFRGIAGDPQEITEETLTLNFTNKLSLQRVAIPDVRIQRTCPWNFPATLAQRQEASDGGEFGRFSGFYRCGYSAGVVGGVGNLNAGQAFTSCDGSRTQCLQRGMFNTDAAGHVNNRYGGFEFIPTSYLVRGAGDKTSHLAAVIDNTAKANDAVPLVYGTGWLKAPVVFARNDGNLTHMEVLLGLGQIAGVLKVVVNDVEIPAAASGTSKAATGWYSMVSDGSRVGAFNLDFTDSSGHPLGDPQGSMAVLSVVVPNAISPGTSTPLVQVLMTGMEVDTYDVKGVKSDPTFSNNPAWIVMDVLQRAGWSASDLNIGTFFQSSLQCGELISTNDINGNPIQIPRYGCNLILSKRQSAATLVRGIRVGASLMLRYGTNGLLELLPEGTLASQQPVLPDGGNSVDPLNGGWPAYEFSDSSANFSGIARNSKGGSSLILTSANISETCNRVSVEFQDEKNEYQQDSLSLSNTEDAGLIGFEIASQSTAMGLPNFNQATRILLRQLDKSTAGNQYVQFQTSFRALKVRPGDLIAVTYLREGFARTPFRVLRLSPSLNYQMVAIMAQVHDDNWYSDDPAVLQLSGRQPNSTVAIPRPLLGTIVHDDSSGNLEYFDFAISDAVTALQDGSAIDAVTVGFSVPNKPSAKSTFLPLVSLSPLLGVSGGTLLGGITWYYAVTATDDTGAEGTLSFTVPASLPNTSNTNTVTLQELSFPTTALSFNVYRGTAPQTLYRIVAAQPITPANPVFVDNGFPAEPIGPPDASFDHANIYYRNEYAGPFPADRFSASTIGWSDMGAVANAYASMVALITEGTGRGQQQSIVSNTQTTLAIVSPWSITPDATSVFVIAEAAWKLAAISSYSPAQFDIPYGAGSVIEVTGRAANILNQESNPALAPITRLALGDGKSDVGLPGTPFCSLETPGGGDLTVFGVGFTDVTNTESVTSGSLQIFCWNELDTPSAYSLSQAVDAASASMDLTVPLNPYTPFVGQFVQIDQEIVSVLSVNAAADIYTVSRGAANSTAAAHNAGALVMQLSTYALVLPFAAGFFANRASNNYINTVSIPDIRISAAEFFVSNSFGNSQASLSQYVSNTSPLRTLSGGQFSLQVNGYLATQQNAAPPLLVETSHAVRDIRITLGQSPTGYVITVELLQNGNPYAQLTYDPSQTTPTSVIDGTNLPPLTESALLTINITLILIPNYTQALNPGRDLTVTIRL
jgi:hypothetical protein